MGRDRLFATTALGALLGCFGAGSAGAQTTAPADPAANVATEQKGLEDIIVTAQRRTESRQHAALAVDVVSAAEIARAGVGNVATLNAAVPSLSVQQGSGANTIYFIRGIGNFTSNGYSDSAIAFNLDGVYVARPTSTTSTFYDLDRIEVLKGPQGTLYGRNATGGAINVIPSRPQIGENSGRILAGIGNYDAREAEGAINLALGDKAAFRVAARWTERDGYNRDGTGDDSGYGVRAQLLVKPNDALSIRIAGDYSHQGGVGPGGTYSGFQRYTPGTAATATSPANYTFDPAGLDARSGLHSPEARTLFAGRTIVGPFINPAPVAYPYQDNDYAGVLAEISLRTAAGTFTLIPAYRHSSVAGLYNGPSFRAGLTDQTDHQTSVEGRFEGKRIGPIDWLVGGYYFSEAVDVKYAFHQYALTSFQSIASRAKSHAVFGRATLNLSDALRLVAAARNTTDKKDFDAAVETLINTCTRVAPPAGPGCFGGPSIPVALTRAEIPGAPTAPGAANGVAFGTFGNRLFYNAATIDKATRTTKTTYRLAAEFDIAPRSLLFASYETGYRSGGFSTAFGRETFQPEYLSAFTLGSKNRFLDNKLQLNLEAFWWKYRDQQVSHFGLDGNNTSAFFTENIGRSTIRGIDVEAQLLATPTTRLNTIVQYLDSKIDTFVYNAPRLATSLPPASGCRVSPATAGTSLVYAVDCSGQRGFNSPKWSINAGVEQTIPIGRYALVLTGAVRYRSNAIIGFDYFAQQNTGGNTAFDLSASFGDIGKGWTATAYVRNLTDRTVLSYSTYSSAIAGSVISFYAPPRTYGARIGYSF